MVARCSVHCINHNAYSWLMNRRSFFNFLPAIPVAAVAATRGEAKPATRMVSMTDEEFEEFQQFLYNKRNPPKYEPRLWRVDNWLAPR